MMSSPSNTTISRLILSHICHGSQDIDKYVTNLTSSYTDKSNEASMVSASVIMFVLAGLFFNLNLFSRFSDVSAILDPKVRLFLSSALSLFLPVMSYLFSEAKNSGQGSPSSTATAGQKADLTLRADVILVWMLLVELLRKKVDEIRMWGYSGTIQRAGRVAWLGSLVFFNIQSVGRKAVFGILWVLCASKVVQRVAFTEVGKRSYAYGKNARLITSYMSQMLKKDQQEHHTIHDEEHGVRVDHEGDGLLKRSKFIVMGEEDLIIEATADGYKLKEISRDDTVVTVGKIWLHLHLDEDRHELKRLCLSFALFKLLRRRFEHLSVTKAETDECRDLIFNGIYNNTEDTVEALFEMMNNEVNFLCEYYHSVIPVVLASPFFFLANYFLLPIVVLGLCVMTVVLCGDGDARYAFRSIKNDNFAISSGIFNTTACLVLKALNRSPPAFFTAVDFFITFFLLFIFFYEEIWEFIVFLLSNWFMVSLLCNYVAKPRWRGSPTFHGAVRVILWLRSRMSNHVLTFKQFSLLNLRWPLGLGMPSTLSLLLRTRPVPNKAKHFIMESLVAHSRDNNNNPLNYHRMSALNGREDLWPACSSDSVAEVILTWHIATSLMEAEYPAGSRSKGTHRVVATRLSKYCAYLVAFHPELLPDNQDKTERVFEAVKEELKLCLRCCNYYFSRRHTRVRMVKSMADSGAGWKDNEVLRNGAKLGNLLTGEAAREPSGDHLESTWRLLANVWTELIVYVAPSKDEERVKAHGNVLVQGSEFITVLWALTTHTGITRQEPQD